MSGRIYKKHENRRKIVRRYIKNDPFFFGFGHSDAYWAWRGLYGREFVYRRPGTKEKDANLLENLSWWDIEQKEEEYKQYYCVRRIDRSRWRGYGKKGYKKAYHVRRRNESKSLEYAALIGDEEAFDRINPEGWRGAIGYDIW